MAQSLKNGAAVEGGVLSWDPLVIPLYILHYATLVLSNSDEKLLIAKDDSNAWS